MRRQGITTILTSCLSRLAGWALKLDKKIDAKFTDTDLRAQAKRLVSTMERSVLSLSL